MTAKKKTARKVPKKKAAPKKKTTAKKPPAKAAAPDPAPCIPHPASSPLPTLAEIYDRHAVRGPDVGHGDKGSLHSYIEEYETLLAPYREKCAFLEIGLALGKSVAMWDEYFGAASTLYGADISLVFDLVPFPRWNFIQADATKPGILDRLGTLDVVIDDGSHQTADQLATMNLLMPRMNPGGLYIIEDILDLEATIDQFPGAEVRDLRARKGRFDDVLLIFRT